MIFGFYISRAICHLLGFLYPAYKSFKALEKKNDELNKHFLTYWVVFAFINLFEFYFEFLIDWLPFYYEAKILFLLWLIFPIQSSIGGASFVFNVYIEPFLNSREKVIDQTLEDLGLHFLIPERNPVVLEDMQRQMEKPKSS